MNYKFAKGNISKIIALLLVFSLLIGSVDLSSVFAVSKEDLLDFSELTTENQMVSEPENVVLEALELDQRVQNFNENWKFKDGD